MGRLTRSLLLPLAVLLLACSGMSGEVVTESAEPPATLPEIALELIPRTPDLLELHNPGPARLTDVLIELNGSYRHHLDAVEPDASVPLHPSRFMHARTAASPRKNTRVEQLTVRCDQGQWSWSDNEGAEP